MQKKVFHILTIGWEPSYIEYFAAPIAKQTGIRFTHGLVGDPIRLPAVEKSIPGTEFIALSKSNQEPLPPPDYELLARLESVGVPTIRSMVQGDRVLRERTESESLGYATFIAKKILKAVRELQPDVVLATFDSLHSSLSLAISKSLGIPWVALAYPVIPDDLTGFCAGMTPDTLVPLVQRDAAALRSRAAEIIRTVRSNRQPVFAYRPPTSIPQRAKQALLHARNFIRRASQSEMLGYDRFTWPTARERLNDIVRRAINTCRLPTGRMIGSPPTTRYAYFPLHMAPESSVDTWAPFYQDQLAFIFQLALALPADFEFVVKIHFGDPDNYSRKRLLELMKLPRLRIARPDASSLAFLQQASLVIGIQGTACIEAALLGKPVLMFGDSPYQHFPWTERANRPDQLYEQIRRMLSLAPPGDEEIEESYAAYMARYMPGRINNWGRPIESDELERLCDCFRALRSYLEVPANRSDWYNRAPFMTETDR